MTTDALHPSHLQPGAMVGPWRILEVLGAGGLGRVFKAERDGAFYALKMSVRPRGELHPSEEDIEGWCQREASALLAYSRHPNLLHVHAVDRWPHPQSGYFYFVTDFIDGDGFHHWRWKAHPTAAQLVDVFCELVRVVAELHRRGLQHRDIKSDNILIRREDGRPFLIDFGSVHLPGSPTLTKGLPPGAIHLLAPEALAFFRGDAWKRGERFTGGVATDLYALGSLLYESLADGYPFNPELATDELVTAIELTVPRAPHRLNPKVPRILSDIAMRLLAKKPEDRFPSAAALLDALQEAAKARETPEWNVPLDLPPEGPAKVTPEEVEERRREQARQRAAPKVTDGPVRRWRWRGWLSGLVLLLTGGLVALLLLRPSSSAHPPATAAPQTAERVQEVARPSAPPEGERGAAPARADTPAPVAAATLPKDRTRVKTPKQKKGLGSVGRVAGAAVAACVGAACPGAQVRPAPPPEECPPGAVEAMEQRGVELGHWSKASFQVKGGVQLITVREGPVLLGNLGYWEKFPRDTRFSGRLIFGEGRVFGRLTTAHSVEGQFPVCLELISFEGKRGMVPEPGGDPDTARIASTVHLKAVSRFE
jgi:serine/threonine-protein kinase